jgi:hypothetical protein
VFFLDHPRLDYLSLRNFLRKDAMTTSAAMAQTPITAGMRIAGGDRPFCMGNWTPTRARLR